MNKKILIAIIALIALMLLVGTVLAAPTITQLTHNTGYRQPSISISGDGSKIAFQSDVDGDYYYEVFVVNSDGTGLKQLTNNAAFGGVPSISGDGSKIAFQSWVDDYGAQIFVVNSDGSGLIQLTHNTVEDSSPSITGDGSKIAFVSNVDGKREHFEIFVVSSDGTGLKQLTDYVTTNFSVHAMYPSICDDGSKIAFHSNAGGSIAQAQNFEVFLWEEENGTGGGDGADSGLSITTIAIIAAIIIVSIIAALYLIIRRRRLNR